MGVSIRTRQAYSEVDEFLSLLNEEQINKVPKQLRELFKEEKDRNYIKGIDIDKPIKDQALIVIPLIKWIILIKMVGSFE